MGIRPVGGLQWARYVRCAESEEEMVGGGVCRVQVCWYARAGNCDMRKYDSEAGDNWKVPMLMDHNSAEAEQLRRRK